MEQNSHLSSVVAFFVIFYVSLSAMSACMQYVASANYRTLRMSSIY